jgi:hypothetical protein
MEVTGRWEKNEHSDKQGFGRFADDAYDEARRVQAKSPQEESWEVLKHWEAVKSRHESRFKANTQTSPIGKGSIYLSALTGTAVRKVTVRDHLVHVFASDQEYSQQQVACWAQELANSSE